MGDRNQLSGTEIHHPGRTRPASRHPAGITQETPYRSPTRRCALPRRDQELELGRCLVAVPIIAGGQVVAALSLSLHAEFGEANGRIGDLAPRLRHTAAQIQADLARQPYAALG